MKNALLQGRLDDFGDLLHQAWQTKKHLDQAITTPHIDEMYEAARRRAPWAAKSSAQAAAATCCSTAHSTASTWWRQLWSGSAASSSASDSTSRGFRHGRSAFEQIIAGHLAESAQVKLAVAQQCLPAISAAAEVLVMAFRSGHKLLACGNGGSAADAQHIVGELVCKLTMERVALPAIALTTNTSILTATGNDYAYDHVFVRQVEALAHPGDVLIAISTSGLSASVNRAAVLARCARHAHHRPYRTRWRRAGSTCATSRSSCRHRALSTFKKHISLSDIFCVTSWNGTVCMIGNIASHRLAAFRIGLCTVHRSVNRRGQRHE